MKTRREFVKLAAGAGVIAAVATGRAAQIPGVSVAVVPAATAEADDRAYWCRIASKLATPVLSALSARTLRATMPVETQPSSKDRAQFTHLEALGRLLAGISPWLELGGDATGEGKERTRFGALARAAIDAAMDPKSPDFMNFSKGQQPLVDTAFLAQALMRAPNELWRKLEPRVQGNVVAALISSRPIKPTDNNWTLFASEIEVFLGTVGEKRDEKRLFTALKKHRDWYVGDGMYGDGAEFHWDYYNSFVIQPMLLDNLDVVGGEAAEWGSFRDRERERLTRWAAIQERLVSSDGSYPVIGRSIAYRCGAFQGLALASLRKMLPPEVGPEQARVALTRVIRRTLEAPGTFDANGWLQIGLSGHQPGLGEIYISTGSLYLCSVALLPLGLPPGDPFWSEPAARTTWEKVWAGENLPADHALPKNTA